MPVLPIYVTPNPMLKKVAEPVAAVTDAERRQLDDMLETMYAAHGIGLAATQVGILKRLVVMDVAQREGEDRGKPLYFVNPEITWESEEINTYNEGCLSIPEQYADVERPKRVKVKFLDYDGAMQEIEADGILATCIQHEIDHLNGILFTDHISSLKRDMILRKVKKWAKENADDIADTHVL
jgi:peptide deformylase